MTLSGLPGKPGTGLGITPYGGASAAESAWGALTPVCLTALPFSARRESFPSRPAPRTRQYKGPRLGVKFP